jgi:N-acetylneuraminic acid mutarotase
MIRAALVFFFGACLRATALEWQELPPLPDARGFAGAFAGVSGGALIVAGGTHFPDKMPWEGGVKVWYDDVFVLQSPDGKWVKAGKLPQANGYGVSITTDDGVVLIGGGNAKKNFREVVRMKWGEGRLSFTPLPSLPKPCALMSGARSGDTLYISGGVERPDATRALDQLWALDMRDLEAGWKVLPPHPGGGRILAASGTLEGDFFTFSGAELKTGSEGKPERIWKKDAWKYSPDKGWVRMADLPRVAVAAPSPVPLIKGSLLVLGGDDGSQVNFEPKEKHPGFPRDVLSYDTSRNRWSKAGDVPFSLVTSPSVIWSGRVVIPGGEARPGVRSPAVWMAR